MHNILLLSELVDLNGFELNSYHMIEIFKGMHVWKCCQCCCVFSVGEGIERRDILAPPTHFTYEYVTALATQTSMGEGCESPSRSSPMIPRPENYSSYFEVVQEVEQ